MRGRMRRRLTSIVVTGSLALAGLVAANAESSL